MPNDGSPSVYHQKAMSELINMIITSQNVENRKFKRRINTTVVIGNYSQSSFHGHKPTPKRGLRKRLMDIPVVNVIEIDEYTASKVCCILS